MMGPNSTEMAKIAIFANKLLKITQIAYLDNGLLYRLGL
jgi:hypothetical protein